MLRVTHTNATPSNLRLRDLPLHPQGARRGRQVSARFYQYPPHQLPFDWVIVDNYTGFVSWSALRFLMAHSIPIVHMAWNGNLYGSRRARPHPGTGQARPVPNLHRTRPTGCLGLGHPPGQADPIPNPPRRRVEAILSRRRSAPYGGRPVPESRWTDTNRLLEFEAKCANVYWKSTGQPSGPSGPTPASISRGNTSYSWNRNAADPINALLNYGYAILEARCRVAVVRAGFDPTIGYLHSIAPSKHPLVYDFQELGRALVDWTILEMVRAQPTIRKKDAFLRTTDWGSGRPRKRPRSSSSGSPSRFPVRSRGSDR